MGDLQGQVVVVTGAAGLVGRELVRAVAESGGVGVVADIDEKGGQRAAAQLAQEVRGGAVDRVIMDITCADSIRSALGELLARHGRVDALVNSAYPRNRNYGQKFEEVSYGDFCENVNLHLGGYFLASQQFASHFKANGGGSIVNIASVYGVIPPRFELYEGTGMTMPVEYAVIKSALIHLTKYLAKYFKGTQVRVNCISPGGVFDHQPERFLERYRGNCSGKGMLDPVDLAGTLVYLLSEGAACVNGQNIVVDDGFTL